jgi:hypothetical protein
LAYYFKCKTNCNGTDLANFNITSYTEINNIRYKTDTTSSCNFYLSNLILQMDEQGVVDISKIDPTKPSSFDLNLPVLTQIQQLFTTFDPVFLKIFTKMLNKTDEFTLNEFVQIKTILKSPEVQQNNVIIRKKIK